ERGRAIIDQMSDSLLRHRLARIAEFVRIEGEQRQKPVPPPSVVVQDVLAAKAWDFPALQAVTEVPVLRADGTVLDVPGYDRTTRLIYQPPAHLHVPPVPTYPSRCKVIQACEALKDVIAEFPFIDSAGTANTLPL